MTFFCNHSLSTDVTSYMTRYLFLLFGVGIGHMLAEKKGREDQPTITLSTPNEKGVVKWEELKSTHTAIPEAIEPGEKSVTGQE